MAASLAEYQEVLRAESHVDLGRLRDWAVHGVPQDVRGEVWKYLLRIAEPDQAREQERQRVMSQDYGVIEKESQEFGRLVKFHVEKYRLKEEVPFSIFLFLTRTNSYFAYTNTRALKHKCTPSPPHAYPFSSTLRLIVDSDVISTYHCLCV